MGSQEAIRIEIKLSKQLAKKEKKILGTCYKIRNHLFDLNQKNKYKIIYIQILKSDLIEFFTNFNDYCQNFNYFLAKDQQLIYTFAC